MNSENNANSKTLETGSSGKAVVEERRGFVKKLAVMALALGAGGLTVQFGRFMSPNVLYEAAKVFKVGEWIVSCSTPSISRLRKVRSFRAIIQGVERVTVGVYHSYGARL